MMNKLSLCCNLRELLSFPTRRSSDLESFNCINNYACVRGCGVESKAPQKKDWSLAKKFSDFNRWMTELMYVIESPHYVNCSGASDEGGIFLGLLDGINKSGTGHSRAC